MLLISGKCQLKNLKNWEGFMQNYMQFILYTHYYTDYMSLTLCPVFMFLCPSTPSLHFENENSDFMSIYCNKVGILLFNIAVNNLFLR